MPGSLVFGAATSDRATHTNTGLDNLANFTYIMWVYVTTLTNLRMLASKDNGAASEIFFALDGTGGNVQLQVGRATANAYAKTNDTPIGASAWRCIAGTWDNGTNPPRIWSGTLSAAMAERGYAATPTAGSGAQKDDSARTFMWGSDAATLALQGRIAVAAIFGSALSSADLNSWKKRPRKTVGSNVALRFVRFGKGAANGIEYAAGDNASVTGATEGNGVPLWQGSDELRAA